MSGDSGGSTASTTSSTSYDQRMVLDGGSIGVTGSSGNVVNMLDAGAIANAFQYATNAGGLANNASMGALEYASKAGAQAMESVGNANTQAITFAGNNNAAALQFAGRVLDLGAAVLDRGQAFQGQQASYLDAAYTDAKGTKDVLVAGALLIGGVVAISFLRK